MMMIIPGYKRLKSIRYISITSNKTTYDDNNYDNDKDNENSDDNDNNKNSDDNDDTFIFDIQIFVTSIILQQKDSFFRRHNSYPFEADTVVDDDDNDDDSDNDDDHDHGSDNDDEDDKNNNEDHDDDNKCS